MNAYQARLRAREARAAATKARTQADRYAHAANVCQLYDDAILETCPEHGPPLYTMVFNARTGRYRVESIVRGRWLGGPRYAGRWMAEAEAVRAAHTVYASKHEQTLGGQDE